MKDSSGTQVGPNSNVFSANHVWADAYGLHHVYAPTAGCSNWAAAEVWTALPVGYGTFTVRFVGTGDSLPPEMIW